jgi:hypothetical protein
MTADLRAMPNGVHEAMWQLFKDGPTWDGNLINKEARTWIVQSGLAFRCNGYNALTETGVEMAVSLGMGERKDSAPL